MQRWVVTCVLALVVGAVGADECPDGGHCERGQSCCQQPSNGFTCCPFEQAECCGDDVHCCPAGTTCDVGGSRCVNATASVPWAERTSTKQPRRCKSFRMIKSNGGDEDDNICPDQSRCPDEFSCLKSLTKYGCCPLAQGSPCSDGKHCCPQSHRCSHDSRSCIKKEVTSAVLCSDGVSECPEESSCCEGPDGQFGCCPMSKAVCCEDKVHCCPEGSLCDLETTKCISVSSKKQLAMWAKFPARRRAEWEDQKEKQHAESPVTKAVTRLEERASNITCDASHVCPDQTTCCSDGQGGFGCCPYINAVCCSDYKHCCPHGTTCDLVEQACVSTSDPQTTPSSLKTTAFTATARSTVTEAAPNESTESEEDEEDEEGEEVELRIQCKGHKNKTCHRNHTCCGHHCCPLPNATCCHGKHCCPHGSACHPHNGTCVKDGVDVPWYTGVPSLPSPEPPLSDEVVSPGAQASNVTCDPTFACSDNETCCSDGQGSWGCCPAPNAVCCDDHIHCCPQGTVCDVAEEKCLPPSQTTSMSPTTPAFTTTAPSATAESQSEESESEEEEEDEEDYEEMISKVLLESQQVTEFDDDDGDDDDEDDDDDEEEDIEKGVHCKGHKNSTCPGNSTCPENSTCCGCHCCPLPKAVCCRHRRHCCPHGHRCHEHKRACVRDGLETPWYSEVPARSGPKPVHDVEAKGTEQSEEEDKDEFDYLFAEDEDEDEDSLVHCDSTSSCPKDYTCCTLGDRWGCCPLPRAVCCPDGEHCCPHRHRCSHSHKACVLDESIVIPWYTKLPALTKVETGSVKHVQCPDGQRCPEYNTCCLLSSNEYGCCPMENAVCCSDKKHCCPTNFSCEPLSGLCQKPVVLEVDFVKLEPAKSQDADLRCGSSACPDNYKCCMNRGMFFCCPYADGVCCNNYSCCPSGQQCGQTGVCTSNSVSSWDDWLFFIKRIKEKSPLL